MKLEKNKKKTWVCIIDVISNEKMFKDIAMIAIVAGKEFGFDAVVVGGETTDTSEIISKNFVGIELVNVKLTKYSFILPSKEHILLLLRRIGKIDVLEVAELHLSYIFLGFIFKILNPRGKFYIKADVGDAENIIYPRKILLKILFRLREKVVDVASVETLKGLANFQKGNFFSGKTVWIPNSSSYEVFPPPVFSGGKENIILTVGRLGTEPKNTECILDALSKVDMMAWKFYLIGPIESSLKPKIDKFFAENPEKRNSVVFLGNMSNKNELAEYYHKAKVFCLTSRWESWGIVLSEAAYFDCFLLTTDVGGARTITNHFQYGKMIEARDVTNDLAKSLSNIILGNVDLTRGIVPRERLEELSYKNSLRRLIKKMNLF